MTGHAYDLETTYLSLAEDGEVAQLPVGPDFWETIGSNPKLRGALVSAYLMDADWTAWEMHPQGDEVLILLEGRATMILDEGGAEQRYEMSAGSTLVVPAGAWHRALIPESCRLMAITFGSGTQHRPVA